MVQIAPSVLAANFAALGEDCRKVVTPQNPLLHFDVMDGVFVPNISVGLPVLKDLNNALPQAQYDVHLMIVRPLAYVEAFAKAGADYITFHCEAESPLEETLCAIRAAGCKAGLSLRPGTPIERVFPYLKLADMVLIMSVEPGFGGQKFMPGAVDRIRDLRAEAVRQGVSLLIEVDGGIDDKTAPSCVRAGADILVAGSAVFGAENPGEMVQCLRGSGERDNI